MSIEIITRQEGSKAEIKQIDRGIPQVSYNSDGRLVIRLIYTSEQDTLIVLDQVLSEKVISFSQEFITNMKIRHQKELDELPF